MTTDTAAADAFYKKVVGWTSVPFAPDGSYTVFNNPSGAGVGGLMTLPDAARQMGAPAHWLMYVGTPNVDQTAMRIAQLGGRVLKQPDNIPGAGRFAVVQDPFGATFGIYQPPADSARKTGGGPGIGDFSWFELYAPNPEGAWNFHQNLFGWEKTSAMDMGEAGVYQMFGRGGGIPNGGIMKPPPGAPAAWMPYAMVKDAKAATATANGGKIVVGPMEVPGGDWIAQGQDPQGAMFAVHSLNPASAKPATAQKAAPARKAAPAKKAARASARTAGKPKKAAKKAAPKKTAKKSVTARTGKAQKARAKPAQKKAAKKTAGKKAPKKAAKRKK